MQTSLNLIDAQPNALVVLSAMCLFKQKTATLLQLENRTTLDTDELEDAISFLEEHKYIRKLVDSPVRQYVLYVVTDAGLQYVNQKTYSDFKLI